MERIFKKYYEMRSMTKHFLQFLSILFIISIFLFLFIFLLFFPFMFLH